MLSDWFGEGAPPQGAELSLVTVWGLRVAVMWVMLSRARPPSREPAVAGDPGRDRTLLLRGLWVAPPTDGRQWDSFRARDRDVLGAAVFSNSGHGCPGPMEVFDSAS